MRIEVRLHASLERIRPGLRAGEPLVIELPERATVGALLDALGVPPREVHLCLVDGVAVTDPEHVLQAGQRVGLFPPVGGG